MLTGTSTRKSVSAGPCRALSQDRSAPATVARMTSFTVPPCAARTALTFASGISTISNRRCGPMGTFRGDCGARPIVTTSTNGLRPLNTSPRSFTASLFGWSACLAIRSGFESCSLIELTRRSVALGAFRGFHGAGAGGGEGSGWRSISTVARSTPETPSSMQWCVLLTMAKRDSPSPSTSHISQSGLSRSSAWEKSRPTSFFNSASPPGAGSAVWRT